LPVDPVALQLETATPKRRDVFARDAAPCRD